MHYMSPPCSTAYNGGDGWQQPAHVRAGELQAFQTATYRMTDMLASGTDGVMTATYTPPLCRSTQPGHGGAPICTVSPPQRTLSARRPVRPRSAPSGFQRLRPGKTEQFREAGQMRWPPVTEPEAHKAQPEPEQVPFRRTVQNAQGFWGGTLWERSLRSKGIELEDPFYSEMGGNVKELREEWQQCAEHRRSVPYSGSTVCGKVAKPLPHDTKKWVERPVAAGKYALNHMEGSRYKWGAHARPSNATSEAPQRRPLTARR